MNYSSYIDENGFVKLFVKENIQENNKPLQEIEKLLAKVCYLYSLDEKERDDWKKYHDALDDLINYGISHWKNDIYEMEEASKN